VIVRSRLVRFAVVLAALQSGPCMARAQDRVVSPVAVSEGRGPSVSPSTSGTPREFDVEASLAEGDRALDVRDAVARAVARSPRMDASRASIDAAEAGVHRATAALMPRLDLGARYTHVDGFPDGRFGTAPAPGTFDQLRALASGVGDPVSRTLFTGFINAQETQSTLTIRIPRDQFAFVARLTVPLSDTLLALLPALRGAEGRVQAEALRGQAAERDVELQTVLAYDQYVEARGVSAVALAAADLARERLAMVQRGLEVGLLTPPDVRSAEAAVAQADEGVARARGAVGLAGAALRTLVGDDARGTLAVRVPLDGGADVPSVESLEAEALEGRPELLALRRAIAAQREVRFATEAQGLPHLAVYAGGDVSNPSARVIPPRDEFIPVWELGTSLSWSPSDLASATFQSQELGAQIARAEAELALAEDGVRLELRAAVEALAAAREAHIAAEAALASASAAARARAAQLAAGEGVLTELSAADLQVTQARLSVLRARLEQARAHARIAYARGRSPLP